MHRWALGVGIALFVVLVSITVATVTQMVNEDAMITLRVARNIALGQGWTYNAGVHYNASSTPLFAIVLGFLGWLMGTYHLPFIAQITSALFHGIAVYLLWEVLTEAGFSLPGKVLACLYAGLIPNVLHYVVGAHEMSLVVTLMLGALLAYSRNHLTLAGILCGLLIIARIDAASWVLILWALYLYRERRVPWQMMGCSLVMALPWFFFSMVYFGLLLPGTVTAKMLSYAGRHTWDLEGFLRTLTVYLPHPRLRAGGLLTTVVGGMELGFFVIGVRHLWQKHRWLLIFPIYVLLISFAYFVGRTELYGWYFVPGQFGLAVVLSAALESLSSFCWNPFLRSCYHSTTESTFRIGYKERDASPVQRQVWTMVISFTTVMLLAGVVMATVKWKGDRQILYGRRMGLGQYILQHSAPDATVVLEPVGYVGYYAQRTMYDTIGLVSPEIVDYKRKYPTGSEHL